MSRPILFYSTRAAPQGHGNLYFLNKRRKIGCCRLEKSAGFVDAQEASQGGPVTPEAGVFCPRPEGGGVGPGGAKWIA